jgi:hypothetical protein
VKRILFFFFVFISSLSAFGQSDQNDSVHYFKEPDNSTWSLLIKFHKNNDTSYVLDVRNGVARYYNSSTDQDYTYLDEDYSNDFISRCPQYAIYSFEKTKIVGIATYTNKKLHGFRKIVGDQITEEGNMNAYFRVGMWKYTDNSTGSVSYRYHLFGGNNEEDGLSLIYYIILFPLLVVTIIVLSIIFSRKGNYEKVFYSYCILFGLSILFLALSFLRNTQEFEKDYVQTQDAIRFFYSLLAFCSIALFSLSIFNFSSWKRRSKKTRVLSIVFVSLIPLSILIGVILFIVAIASLGKIGG